MKYLTEHLSGKLYFTERLRKKLARIPDEGITLVEAGSGYGKTTAVREALKSCANVYWHTAYEDSIATSFSLLFRTIMQFCPEVGARLLALELPNRSNAEEIADALLSLSAEEPVYLVLDNFHWLFSALAKPIVRALLTPTDHNIHIILIAHDLSWCVHALPHPQKAVIIHHDDLCLRKYEIKEYYAESGVMITGEQAYWLREQSEGWVAVISLHLSRCLKLGIWVDETKLDEILTPHLWQWLSLEEQEKLIAYSFFDHLSLRQICELDNTSEFTDATRRLLAKMPLVHLDDAKQHYTIHVLLQNYLTDQSRYFSKERLHKVCQRVGLWCSEHGDTVRALTAFYRCKDFEDMLSLDLVGLFQVKLDGEPFEQIAESLSECATDDMIARHPISMLRIAYILFGSCKFVSYNKLMKRLRCVIDTVSDLTLLGEWLLIDGFSVFPDLTAMGERYREAALYLGGQSHVISPNEPYMFGCPSMWMLFHTRSGHMEETADLFSETLAQYTALTGGHGSGADEIYRGETYCVQGRYDEAEICAYKAAYLAENAREGTVSYGAAMLLAIIAVYKGDDKALQRALSMLETFASKYMRLCDTPQNTCMLETVRGYLSGLLLMVHNYPVWARDSGAALTQLTFANFLVHQSRVTDLVLQKDYVHAIARIEVLLASDERLASVATRIFMLAGLALCCLATGRIGKAVDALDMSLSLATPDRNYTFLARFRKIFGVLFIHPRISRKHKQAIREIRSLKLQYAAPDDELVFRDIAPSHLPTELTPREREIAHMAANGMRNQEIAKALNITETTVKSHMNLIFQKLDIDRRSRIKEMLG